jgi:hypothetical protein
VSAVRYELGFYISFEVWFFISQKTAVFTVTAMEPSNLA